MAGGKPPRTYSKPPISGAAKENIKSLVLAGGGESDCGMVVRYNSSGQPVTGTTASIASANTTTAKHKGFGKVPK